MERRGAPKKVVNKKEIGRRIAEARKQAGLTQEELREQIGRQNVKSISDWERGFSTPTKKTLMKIASICGVSYGSIYSTEDAETELQARIIQNSMTILQSFNPIEYHLSVAVKNALEKADLKKAGLSVSDLDHFEKYMELSIKNSMEFFINNLLEQTSRKDDQ